MIYYFYGLDWIRIKHEIDSLYKKQEKTLRRVFFDLRDNSIEFLESLKEIVSGQNLFNQRFFIIVKTDRFLKEQSRFFEKLILDIKEGGNLLVIWENSEKASLSFLTKSFKHKTQIKAFPFLKGEKLKKWLREYMNQKQLVLSDALLDALVVLFGNQTDFLVNEIEKINLFMAYKRVETVAPENLVGRHTESDFFQWIQGILQKDPIRILENMPRDSSSFLQRTAGLINVMRVLIVQKEQKIAYAARVFAVKSFWLKQINAWARQRSFEELVRFFCLLLEVDLAVRSGKMEWEHALKIINLAVIS